MSMGSGQCCGHSGFDPSGPPARRAASPHAPRPHPRTTKAHPGLLVRDEPHPLDGVLQGDVVGLEVPPHLVLATPQGARHGQAGGLAQQVVAGLVREPAVSQHQLDVGDLWVGAVGGWVGAVQEGLGRGERVGCSAH